MAKAIVKMPEEFLTKLAGLGTKAPEIIEESLKAGGKVMLERVCSGLSSAVGNTRFRSRTTGELLSSLGMTPVKRNRNGIYNIKIGFNEPRRKQYAAKKKRSYYTITNALIGNVLEYGKSGQPARPFLRPARSAGKKECIEAMRQKLESEVGSL